MGKAQSKRSVDITTDPKKSGEGDEVAGKVEKIEDIDQKEAGSSTPAAVNGDATPQEKGEASEKKENEESENDKDLTTEKTEEAAADGGDAAATPKTPETPKEEQKEGGAEEVISPLADESTKSKSKKDKMKKKWSFRNISFGKKDKQKPAKSEETTTTPPESATASATATAAPVTNGEAEKTEEKKEDGAGGDASTVGAIADSTTTETKTTQNGDASVQEKQLNGDKTPSPTEEQPKLIETNESAAAVATATETTPAAAVATVNSNNDDTAKENVPEVADTTTTTTTVETVAAAAPVESVAAATPVTNGNAAAEEVSATNTNNTDESNNKASIPAVNDVEVEKPHQNGTNGDDHHVEVADSEPADAEQIKNKSQIEVKRISAEITVINFSEFEAASDQTQSQNITISPTTLSALLSHVNDDDNDVVANIQSFDNVPSSNEISKEEEEEQVVASIIAAVSESPKTADTDITITTTTNNMNIMPTTTTSIDNEVHVPQQQEQEQQKEQDQEQLSGEGVSISNVEKPDSEPSLPPPPLPVTLPPSQVSVFAFKDSTETTTTTTPIITNIETTNNTNNETATIIKTTIPTPTTANELDTISGAVPTNDEELLSSELSDVSSVSKESNDDEKELIPEQESIVTKVLEEAESKDEPFEIIDITTETVTNATPELPEEEKLSVTFSTKVTISETIETDEPAATIIDNEELQNVKTEAEQLVTEVTEEAAQLVMQKQIEEDEKIAETNSAAVVVGTDESVDENQRPPTPLPPADKDDADDASEKKETMSLSENIQQVEEDHDSNAAIFVDSKKDEQEKCLVAPVAIPTDELSVLNMQNNTITSTINDEINGESAATVDHHSNNSGDANENTSEHHIIGDDEKVNEINSLIKGDIEIEAHAPASEAETAEQSTTHGLEDDSTNKDIASAKDLKENVAAEIITQDLAVTCE